MDYIDFEEGTGKAVWNRTWSYEYEDKPHTYHKGEPVGRLMEPWVKVKRTNPELFKNIMVIQQPAAFRDTVVVGECMKDLAETLPSLLMQHDLVGCQSSPAVKRLRMHLHQADALIAGDMTACLQLIDIICAKKVKDISRAEAAFVKKWLKRKAAHTAEAVKYVVGPLEVMMIMN